MTAFHLLLLVLIAFCVISSDAKLAHERTTPSSPTSTSHKGYARGKKPLKAVKRRPEQREGGYSNADGLRDLPSVNVVAQSAGIAGWLDYYSHLLDVAPIPTKMISSAIVGGLGDILLQKINRDPIDLRRLAVFSTVTMFYIAPTCHFWYNTLEVVPTPANLRPALQNALKLIIDQTFGAAMVNMGFFFAFALSDRLYPPYEAGRESFVTAGINSCKNNLWPALLANWTCWPFINYVNLSIIPLKYRVLFSNFAAVFWNMFLSSVVNRKQK
jgi:hypothetical protein